MKRKRYPVLGRGELERSVADVLWDARGPRTAREVADCLPGRELALTTVLTVLGRLEAKGIVRRQRDGRAHAYEAVTTRSEHTAELMKNVLDGSGDRNAVLLRFVGSASEDDLAALRRALKDR